MLPIHECRQEVSRLLGLIGAPPLHWNVPETQSCNVVDETIKLTRDASGLVVEFLEANVQFVLAIDEAYQWLQISSSLHLGLGPRSQCVERVERASIAREFRKSRRRSSDDARHSENFRLEPQKGLGKSILSLSNVRHNLAQTMVDQSDSILHLSYSIQETLSSSSSSPLDIYQSDPLEFPDVIDLIWIKGARQQLANDLSNSLNIYSTFEGLLEISSNLEFRTLMESAMWSARNAREYLLGNLLLEKTPCTANPLLNPKDPVLLSLMQYREQVDALSGAIWSCQQYEDTESEHGSKNQEQMEWWNHVRQLSEICRTMESEIGQRFFAISIDDHGDKELELDGQGTDDFDNNIGSRKDEEYQINDDDNKDSLTETKVDEQHLPTKTVVFKGHGMKEERPISQIGRPDGTRETMYSLPPRDSVCERQMIQELQNRITAIRQAEEEEDDQDDLKTDATNNKSRLRAAPLFLGASGSLLNELRQTLPSPSYNDEEHVLEE